MNNIYRTLSVLLLYPETDWLACLPQLQDTLRQSMGAEVTSRMQPLLNLLAQDDLIGLQERYVATFDRNPSHSLHLFEHIHGESRDRGQAMVDLLQEYRRHGFEMVGDELPDYVPLFLEFLAQLPATEAANLLGSAIDVLAHLGKKLQANGSAYAAVFAVLELLSPIMAKELQDAPVRDMDEAMQSFGPGSDGIEPLLKQGISSQASLQPLNFYPRAAKPSRV